MANQPKTPLVAFRLSESEREELRALASAEGVSVTELMREAVRLLLTTRRGV